MIRFKNFIELKEEISSMGSFHRWWIGVEKFRSLSQRIQSKLIPKKQNDLISQQNTLLSYISGLGVGSQFNR